MALSLSIFRRIRRGLANAVYRSLLRCVFLYIWVGGGGAEIHPQPNNDGSDPAVRG